MTVLPQIDTIDFKITQAKLRIDIYRASGGKKQNQE